MAWTDILNGDTGASIRGKLNALGASVDDIIEADAGGNSIDITTLGVVGNGVTDDTAAIQAAVSSLASGGELYFPRGVYRITGPINITVEGVRLVGAGRKGTKIAQATPGSKCFYVKGHYFSLSDMSIEYQTQGTAGGNAIDMEGVFYSSLQRLSISRPHKGVYYHAQSNSHSANDLVIEDATSNGVHINSAVNVLWARSWIINGSITTSCTAGCIKLENQVEGVNFTDVHTFQGVYSLLTTATNYTTGAVPAFNKFNAVYFDAAPQGVVLDKCNELDFNNCWFSARGTGAYINQVDGIRFTGGNIINCDLGGAILEATSKRVSFQNMAIRSNGSQTTNTYAGISVAANTNDFRISGCTFTNATVSFGVQKNGIYVAPGTSDRYIITENLVTGNGSAGVSDGGTGSNKLVASNF